MNRKIIIVLILLAVVILGAVLIFALRGEEELVVEVDNIQTTFLEGGRQLISNPVQGYTITVPDSWQVPEFADRGDTGLLIFYPGATGRFVEGVEFEEGLLLRIKAVRNPNSFADEAWFDALRQSPELGVLLWEELFEGITDPVRVGPNRDLFRFEVVYAEGTYFEGEFIPAITDEPNTSDVNYFAFSGGAIYQINCFTRGNNYQSLAGLCEQYATTFQYE